MQEICEKEFYAKYKDIFYKTSNSEFGKHKTQIPPGKSYKKNSSFTTVIPFPINPNENTQFNPKHLYRTGMYRNHSLNTTIDRERYMKGEKDWMYLLN
jgi:hypothetical protein